MSDQALISKGFKAAVCTGNNRINRLLLHSADQKCLTSLSAMLAQRTAAVCPRLRESRTRSRQVRVNYIGEKRGGMLTFQEEASVSGERREAVAAVRVGAKNWCG